MPIAPLHNATLQTPPLHIRPVVPAQRAALLALAVETGLFAADDAEALLGGVLDASAADALEPGHAAVCCVGEASDAPLGWAYFAPDPHAQGVWNLWWIGAHPDAQGQGAGAALLAHAERAAAQAGARIMIIETSDQPPTARARAFYRKAGYAECGPIADFYGEGDAKLVFHRRIDRPAAPP